MFDTFTFQSKPLFGYSAAFISFSILCEFAMLRNVYILLTPLEKEVHSSSLGDRCTHLAAHSSERLNSLYVIVIVCLGNTSKNKTVRQLLRHCSSESRLMMKLLINWAQFTYNLIKSLQEDQRNTNKEFNCIMVVIIRPSNTLQFQYFCYR